MSGGSLPTHHTALADGDLQDREAALRGYVSRRAPGVFTLDNIRDIYGVRSSNNRLPCRAVSSSE